LGNLAGEALLLRTMPFVDSVTKGSTSELDDEALETLCEEDAMKRAMIAVLVVAGLSLPATTASALEEPTHSIALYGIGAFLDGDVSFGENETEIDVDASDVIDSLEAAAMARYRGQTERWAIVLDAQFAGLGDSGTSGPVTTDLDFDLFLIQADAAYRFDETTEALFGVRYVRFESEVDLFFAGDGTIHRENDASLIDPVIGVRTLRPLGEKLRLQAQGDIGGGGDMDFTWQGMIHIGYQSSDAVSLWLGYRAIGMDFDDSGGRNRLSADIVMHGPEAGVAFHF
jgi:hypothetical protein